MGGGNTLSRFMLPYTVRVTFPASFRISKHPRGEER